MKKFDSKDIKNIIKGSTERLPEKKKAAYISQHRLAEIQSKWPEIVGETMASHTFVYRYSNGKLFIQVDHGIYAQQLNMVQNSVCSKLSESMRISVSSLATRVGQIYWSNQNLVKPKVRDIMSNHGEMVNSATEEKHPNFEILKELIAEVDKITTG